MLLGRNTRPSAEPTADSITSIKTTTPGTLPRRGEGPAIASKPLMRNDRSPTMAMAIPDRAWTAFHVCLAILLLSFVWRFQDFYPILGKLQIVTLSMAAAVGLFALSGYIDRIPLVSKSRVFKVALILMLLTIPSSLLGIYPTQSIMFITQDYVKNFLLMVLVMAGLRGRKDVERMAFVQIIGAIGLSYWVVRWGRVQDGRLVGSPYYDANDISLLVVCTLPFCVYLARFGRTIEKWMVAAAVPLLLITFVKTGSRGGFLALLAIGAFFAFRFTAFSKKARITAVVVGIAGLTIFAGEQYWSTMKTLANPTQDYNWAGNAETGRMEVWKRGVGYMIRYPLLGVGPSNFGQAEGTLSARSELQQYGVGFKWSTAHNSFVQIGAELGVVGLIVFVMMLMRSYRAAYEKRSIPTDAEGLRTFALGQAIAASFIGYAVNGFFLSQGYSALLSVLVGLVIAFHTARDAEVSAPVTEISLAPSTAPRGRGGMIVSQQMGARRAM